MESKNILVIEDNEMNMKLVRSLLAIGQHCVVEATNAETGIQLARERPPDLILMDIQLPKMDGLTATRIIREDSTLDGIPIIAVSSYAMQGDEEKALAAGCIGYITKPIDTRGFLATLDQYLK